MSKTSSDLRRSSLDTLDATSTHIQDGDVPWLTLVADKVKSLQYGVVQIVVHDSRVVQVERTERHRFEVPRAS